MALILKVPISKYLKQFVKFLSLFQFEKVKEIGQINAKRTGKNVFIEMFQHKNDLYFDWRLTYDEICIILWTWWSPKHFPKQILHQQKDYCCYGGLWQLYIKNLSQLFTINNQEVHGKDFEIILVLFNENVYFFFLIMPVDILCKWYKSSIFWGSMLCF